MQEQINIFYKGPPPRRIFRFSSSSPLAILGILFALVWLLLVITTAIKLAHDYYYPYEGTVLKIETRWYDHITFEFTTWEHLIIETPEGREIDRLVSMEIRMPNRISPGDYVIKNQGFGHPVKPRDKKTDQELIEQWKSMKGRVK